MKLNMKTPIKPLNNVGINAIVEFEGKNLYNGTVTIQGDQLIINLSGKIKVSFAKFFFSKFINKYLQNYKYLKKNFFA